MFKETIVALLKTLNRRKVPYLLFGMEALNVHLAREKSDTFVTRDSDFLFDPSLTRPNTVLEILKRTAFPEEVHIAWKSPLEHKTLYDGMIWKQPRFWGEGTLTLYTPLAHYSIDLAFAEAVIPFPRLWERSSEVKVYGVTIRIAAKSDILEMKRRAGREKDLAFLARLRAGERDAARERARMAAKRRKRSR